TYGLEGRMPVKKLPRLAAALASDQGEVKVELTAGRDAARRVMVTGRIDAELTLTCQRCLEPVTLAVHAEPELAWVTSDEALAAPTLSVESSTGETHRRHHITADGFYRGKKILNTKRDD